MSRRLSVEVAVAAAVAALLIEVSGGSASASGRVVPADSPVPGSSAVSGGGTIARQEVPRGSTGAQYYLVPQASGLTVADVAGRVLGDRALAPQVFALNRGRPQPDGSTLQEIDQPLHVGWRLVLPAGATTVGQSPDVRTGTPPPVTATAAPAAPVVVTTFLGLPVTEAAEVGAGVGVVALAVVGAVLGVRRRRRGRLHEAPRRARAPRSGTSGAGEPGSGSSEAGRPAREVLDRALAVLPTAARPHVALVGRGRTSLRLTPPLPEGAPPWRVGEQGATWEVLDWQLDGADGATPGRFPLFVPVGTVDGEWTAVNLGRAPGLIAVPGDLRAARAAVAELADEVAGGPGAPAVVVVGDLPGSRAAAERWLRVRTVQDVPGPVFGRTVSPGASLGDVWDRLVPEAGALHRQLVVVATPVSPADAEVLAALAARSDDTAAVLVVGDSPYAAWRFEPVRGVLDLGILGLRLDGFPVAAGPGRASRPER